MNREAISLAGTWQIKLDPSNQGIKQKWFAESFTETIDLPGTTDEAHLGELTNEACEDRLSRVYRWIGPAWYRKSIEIPAEWTGKKIFLYLERTKNSQVWINDKWAGSDDSLSTPHEFDLSSRLSPGKHTLTILVDNAKLPPVGPCHQVDERTQTNWNGILGEIKLLAKDPVYIKDLQAYPNAAKREVLISARIINDTNWTGPANFNWTVANHTGEANATLATAQTGKLPSENETSVSTTIKLPDSLACWDEFEPSILKITLLVKAMPVTEWMSDSRSITCGLRTFGTHRGQFVINGRPTYLRGRVDSAIFPLTGYAPMDKTEWLRLLSIAKSYGLNHYRFHSWCPPEAAFAAADELGFYFLAELPNKREITAPGNKDYRPPAEAYETLAELEGDGGPPAIRTAYLLREGERILKQYGNHPSFVMLTLGNELGGDEAVMRSMCDHFRKLDKRHIYAMGSGHFHWDLGLREGDDFWVTRGTAKDLPVRGASFEAHCHIDHAPPSTTVDYRRALQGVPVPVITHENAEFEVYPNYREIKKYNGVLRARNFEIFRERLKKAGMLDQADDFLKASGALSLICHREDIEACLRTPGHGGFHLLDLMDFSGQGTALVGILDAFMDSKGLTTPAAWRQFCCETVPLLWMTKYTWTNIEPFQAQIRMAHYGPTDLPQQALTWTLKAGTRILAKGSTRKADIPTGQVTEVDIICADLSSCQKATKAQIVLSLPGTPYKNTYDLWIYPARNRTDSIARKPIIRTINRTVLERLEKGESLLVIPKPGTLKRTVAMAFQTGFWSPMFRMGARKAPDGREVPGTQGILLDPKHPLFHDFPTEFHSNWQWWQLVKHCDPMILNDTPASFRPIVQVIDGIDRNHKLGLILEARVGKGKLLVCTIDLPSLQENPEARQLLACLHQYIAGKDFCPKHELTFEQIKTIL